MAHQLTPWPGPAQCDTVRVLPLPRRVLSGLRLPPGCPVPCCKPMPSGVLQRTWSLVVHAMPRGHLLRHQRHRQRVPRRVRGGPLRGHPRRELRCRVRQPVPGRTVRRGRGSQQQRLLGALRRRALGRTWRNLQCLQWPMWGGVGSGMAPLPLCCGIQGLAEVVLAWLRPWSERVAPRTSESVGGNGHRR